MQSGSEFKLIGSLKVCSHVTFAFDLKDRFYGEKRRCLCITLRLCVRLQMHIHG